MWDSMLVLNVSLLINRLNFLNSPFLQGLTHSPRIHNINVLVEFSVVSLCVSPHFHSFPSEMGIVLPASLDCCEGHIRYCVYADAL